jgi:phosphoheptose isomerase
VNQWSSATGQASFSVGLHLLWAQLCGQAVEHGIDVFVAISGSGNSENILRAARFARDIGCTVIGLTGFDGGKLLSIASINLTVPAATIEEAEDGHLILNHAFCTAIRHLDQAGVPA